MPDVRYRFYIFATFCCVLSFVGTAGYVAIEGWTVWEGLYMTAITVSTVGYGEVRELSDAGRAFTMFIIFAGLVGFSAGVSLLTSTLIEFRVDRYFRLRQIEKSIMKLTGHYIVCGAGRVGRIVIDEFRARGVAFVVVESDTGIVQSLEEAYTGIHHVHGNAASDEILLKAGIERAQGLISALSSDADNLYVCLAARELNRNLRIIARAEDDEGAKRMEKAGANHVISPARTGGHRILDLLFQPGLINFLDSATRFGGRELALREFSIAAGSPVSGSTLAESQIPQKTGLIVIAVKKPRAEDWIFNPSGATRLDAGDEIVVLGDTERLDLLASLVLAR